ncbi:Ribosomal RNA small subunit methyltransferase D [Lachnospiraceae bacterium TWA4]|nr:Ribosomal RNA small subunit methyltransferase D [Lachnospiraceae bacterium TWA4]
MRVIAGTAKRLPLKTPKGMDTRPTQDRIKETLFNMLQPEIPRCTFWIYLLEVEELESRH